MWSNFGFWQWLSLHYQKCSGQMKNLGMSTQQKPLPQGVPASSPQSMLGSAFPAAHRATGGSEHGDGWDRRVQPSRMSCQTTLHQTRWEGIPTAGSTEQTMLLRGAWQTNLGQNLYILMKKQRPLRQGILQREQTDSEVRELYCMFKLCSTDQIVLRISVISTSCMSLLKHALGESRKCAKCTYDTHIIKSFNIETAIVNHISLREGIR